MTRPCAYGLARQAVRRIWLPRPLTIAFAVVFAFLATVWSAAFNLLHLEPPNVDCPDEDGEPRTRKRPRLVRRKRAASWMPLPSSGSRRVPPPGAALAHAIHHELGVLTEDDEPAEDEYNFDDSTSVGTPSLTTDEMAHSDYEDDMMPASPVSLLAPPVPVIQSQSTRSSFESVGSSSSKLSFAGIGAVHTTCKKLSRSPSPTSSCRPVLARSPHSDPVVARLRASSPIDGEIADRQSRQATAAASAPSKQHQQRNPFFDLFKLHRRHTTSGSTRGSTKRRPRTRVSDVTASKA